MCVIVNFLWVSTSIYVRNVLWFLDIFVAQSQFKYALHIIIVVRIHWYSAALRLTVTNKLQTRYVHLNTFLLFSVFFSISVYCPISHSVSLPSIFDNTHVFSIRVNRTYTHRFRWNFFFLFVLLIPFSVRYVAVCMSLCEFLLFTSYPIAIAVKEQYTEIAISTAVWWPQAK